MNWRIFLLGAFFGLIETAYFGWNLTPQSSAEVICDGITAVIVSLALIKG